MEILMLNKDNFSKADNNLEIDIHTAKRGVRRKVMIPLRHSLVKELWNYVYTLPPATPIFNMLIGSRLKLTTKKDKSYCLDKDGNPKVAIDTTYKLYNHFKHVFDGTELEGIPPYYLRHSRFTAMSEKGATMNDIKIWKGARDLKSVNAYMHRSLEQAKKISRLID